MNNNNNTNNNLNNNNNNEININNNEFNIHNNENNNINVNNNEEHKIIDNNTNKNNVEHEQIGQNVLNPILNSDEQRLHHFCVVCLLNPSKIIFVPCGHKCICQNCYEERKNQLKNCPICRRAIENILERVYEV